MEWNERCAAVKNKQAASCVCSFACERTLRCPVVGALHSSARRVGLATEQRTPDNFMLTSVSRVFLEAVLLAMTAPASASASAGVRGSLIVCIEEAQNLADLDVGESNMGGEGSDAFVAVFSPGADGEFFVTSPVPDTAHPTWNSCFTMRGLHDEAAQLSFVVLDADVGTADDVIGTACTTAATGDGSHWLDLTGPSAEDQSERGRIKVRTFLFADANATSLPEASSWETVKSAKVTPTPNAAAAVARVACPAGKVMTACACSTEAEPGCAASHIESFADEGGREYCVVTANVLVPKPTLPTCTDDGHRGRSQEVPGVTCNPAGWTPPRPGPIHAAARCTATLGAGPQMPTGLSGASSIVGGIPGERLASWTLHDEASPPSRSTWRDATEATCSSGLLTGCSTSSSAGGLGTRIEDGDGDGRQECVAFSDGDNPVTAQARCAEIRLDGPAMVPMGGGGDFTAALAHLSLPVMATTELGSSGTWTAAGCPPPFRLSGCGCYSGNGNCLGAHFERVLASDGSGSGALAMEICNVSHVLPPHSYRAGAEAHAMCMWMGSAGSLLGTSASRSTCAATVPAAGSGSVPDKSWLPPEWRSMLRVSAESGRDRRWRGEQGEKGAFGFGVVTGMLLMVCLAASCQLGILVVRARKRTRLGGAPTMPTVSVAPPHRIGDVVAVTSTAAVAGGGYTAPVVTPVPVVTPAASTPLVLSDSAQEQANGGSRV